MQHAKFKMPHANRQIPHATCQMQYATCKNPRAKRFSLRNFYLGFLLNPKSVCISVSCLSNSSYCCELDASAASTAPLRATALPRSSVEVGMVRVATPAALVKTSPPMVEKATEALVAAVAAVAAAAGADTIMPGREKGAGAAVVFITEQARARINRPITFILEQEKIKLPDVRSNTSKTPHV